MSDVISPGSGVVYMKVGTHADEPLSAIIERKRAEIDAAGFALWGYGGNTCHPTTMVQPFARGYQLRGQTIHLVMHAMTSNHFAVTARAEEMSVDGRHWTQIPRGINVIGSRYALAIADLEPAEFTLPLARTRVAEGNNKGRPGSQYIQGRVDKAVLDVVADAPGGAALDHEAEEIGLIAKIVEPYAVFVRIGDEL